MTRRALAEINGASYGCRTTLLKRFGHAEFVGVDIQNVCLRIEGRTAPFTPAVRARVHQCVFANHIRRELACVVQLTKPCQCPRMRLGRSRCEGIFCDELPYERSRHCRERLLLGSNLAWRVAGGGPAV